MIQHYHSIVQYRSTSSGHATCWGTCLSVMGVLWSVKVVRNHTSSVHHNRIPYLSSTPHLLPYRRFQQNRHRIELKHTTIIAIYDAGTMTENNFKTRHAGLEAVHTVD